MAVYADGTKVRVGDIIRPIDNPVDSWTAYVSSVAEVESIDRSHCAMGNVYFKVGGGALDICIFVHLTLFRLLKIIP